METYRLKMKIGDHEFEAEGPVDVVQNQFAEFKELIEKVPATKAAPIQEPTIPITPTPTNDGASATNNVFNLEKIMRLQGRVVSLTVPAESVSEAVMVLLFGQRHLRTNDSVTGGEVMDGLRESGTVVNRVDAILDRLASEGSVIRIGTGRARRYRLTNIGVARAQEITRALISLVP
jgi:hypothetical protein